ncbi:hypothetical protein CRE_23639 [Caenorhabditis remanei]|uniref:Uncharacterized protein n=1 Tax=Caenorhabditis remanei TaxID=31234 RepID=E3N483_CAERE|nr:hypothetical protein CRE_23639 [Caenorhabditis remanei]
MQKMRYNCTLEATIQSFTSSCELLNHIGHMPTYAILDKKNRHSHGYPGRLCIDGYSIAEIKGNGRIHGTPGSKCLEGQKDGFCVSKNSCVCNNFYYEF